MHAVNTTKHTTTLPILIHSHLCYNVFMSGLAQVFMFKTPPNPLHQRNMNFRAVPGVIRQYFSCAFAGVPSESMCMATVFARKTSQ